MFINMADTKDALFVSWLTWWFRDSLAYLKLSFGSSIYRVWKLIDTPYQAIWDTMYWGFLGARIRRIFLDGYGVLRLRGEMIEVCQDRTTFIRELESVAGVTVTAKTAVFFKEMMDKKGSREVLTMAWLPMCGELRSSSNSVYWEPMFILYCRRSMIEDYRLASEINRVAREVNNVVVVKDQFLEELDSLGVLPMPAKMAEFLREIQMRDKETVAKLHILEREIELNARKKNLFIQKLKGVILY
ncbi:hypothetical protein Tco_0394618 [Tanacetum coccineum]